TFTPNLFSLGFKPWDERPDFDGKADVVFVTVSPPNRQGYCHFGAHNWTKRDYVRRTPLVIAEVDPSLIEVFGDVHVHVSELDYIVEYTPPSFSREQFEALIAPLPPERAQGFRDLLTDIPVQRLAPLAGALGAVSPQDVRNFF